ncbi:MAG: LCP family protein [Nitriliruptoraceae bacterium]
MPEEVPRVWGPVIEGRARRRRRWLLAMAIVAGLIVAVVAATSLWVNAQLPRVAIEGLADRSNPTHILLVGNDSRTGLTAEERRELSTGSADGERADTIIVLTTDGTSNAMLAFPRDLWVHRCDGSAGRINAAIAIDGPGCLIDTIYDVSGIRAHHYIEITFGGFRNLVDAVDGVELCLEQAISDRDAGIDLSAGCQVLDGTDALGYVRVRKIDDDLQRITRQQQFIQALAAELTSPQTLRPTRMFSIARNIGQAVTVDDSLGPVGLARLGWATRGIARGAVVTHTVPVVPRTTSAGAAVLDLQVTEAEPLFSQFRTGAIFAEVDVYADVPVANQPADIDVAVLNGAGIAGIAMRTGDDLGAAGFNVVAVDNTSLRDATLILYPPGRRADAALVGQHLGVTPTLDETSAVTVITVVLGGDAQP